MKKNNQSLGGVVAIGAALVGTALGAAAVVLSDKKNQEKIKKTIDDISSDAVKMGKNIKKKADEFTKNTKQPGKTAKKTVKKAAKKTTAKKPASPAKK